MKSNEIVPMAEADVLRNMSLFGPPPVLNARAKRSRRASEMNTTPSERPPPISSASTATNAGPGHG
jgi:hypothetical protein